MITVVEKYYTHTTEGHNKDYRMVIDYSANTLECHWGPIGGAKQVDRYATRSREELDNLIAEKHMRRLHHGYVDMGMTAKESSGGYTLDVSEMLEAERLGA